MTTIMTSGSGSSFDAAAYLKAIRLATLATGTPVPTPAPPPGGTVTPVTTPAPPPAPAHVPPPPPAPPPTGGGGGGGSGGAGAGGSRPVPPPPAFTIVARPASTAASTSIWPKVLGWVVAGLVAQGMAAGTIAIILHYSSVAAVELQEKQRKNEEAERVSKLAYETGMAAIRKQMEKVEPTETLIPTFACQNGDLTGFATAPVHKILKGQIYELKHPGCALVEIEGSIKKVEGSNYQFMYEKPLGSGKHRGTDSDDEANHVADILNQNKYRQIKVVISGGGQIRLTTN